MLKKTLYFTRACTLNLKNNQLKIHFNDDDSERSVPVEDIGYVVLENQRISFTAPLMTALSENNVSVIFTDSRMMPVSMLMTLEGNSVHQEVFRNQINATVPLNKGLWKQIICSKILNQSRLLNKLGFDGSTLSYYSRTVKSGDSDNREGAAARLYWPMMFGDCFARDRYGDSPNNMLNYGYSILRAATARALTGSGLLPLVGIFHKNRYNSFPLADDLMEPFRPFVDEVVYYLYENGERELTTDVKKHILEVLTCDTSFGDEMKPLSVGLTTVSASLAKCYSGDSRKLILPVL